jgi:signal transduction histidine kinase
MVSATCRARAAMINGNIVIKSGAGNGTKISVTAPY